MSVRTCVLGSSVCGVRIASREGSQKRGDEALTLAGVTASRALGLGASDQPQRLVLTAVETWRLDMSL